MIHLPYDPHDEPERDNPGTCPSCGAALENPWPGSRRAICPNGCGEDA